MDRILVIDDDLELSELVGRFLEPEGFKVHAVGSGEEGAEMALFENRWKLIILDVMLPGINGFEVLRRIRRASKVPVLMLTARGADVDRIVGLEIGADDYLPKPFNPRELVARIHAILRRSASADVLTPNQRPLKLSLDDVELDSGTRIVRRGGYKVKLTTVEFDLLRVLMESAGNVVAREVLIKNVLGRQVTYSDRSIDIHVSNLRRKLGPAKGGEDRIKTIRNSGYMYPLSSDVRTG